MPVFVWQLISLNNGTLTLLLVYLALTVEVLVQGGVPAHQVIHHIQVVASL